MASPTENIILRNAVDVFSFSNNVGIETYKELLAVHRLFEERLKSSVIAGESFRTRRLRQSLRELEQVLEAAGLRITDKLNMAKREVIANEYSSVAVALADEVAIASINTSIPISRLDSLVRSNLGGKPLEAYTQKMTRQLYKDVQRTLFEGISEGVGPRIIGDRLRERFAMTRNESVRLARTTLMDVNNKANVAVFNDNQNAITSYTFMATLDSRTCLICAPNDGLTANTREELPFPPLHPNCRCLIRPNTEFTESKFAERDTVIEEERIITNHRDGSTSSRYKKIRRMETTQSWNDFFKSQPAEWQRSVLGPVRYNLWKAGKVNLGDFANKSRVLSLSQLRNNMEKGVVNQAERLRKRLEGTPLN